MFEGRVGMGGGAARSAGSVSSEVQHLTEMLQVQLPTAVSQAQSSPQHLLRFASDDSRFVHGQE